MAEVSKPARQVSQKTLPRTMNGVLTGRLAAASEGRTKRAKRITNRAMNFSSSGRRFGNGRRKVMKGK